MQSALDSKIINCVALQNGDHGIEISSRAWVIGNQCNNNVGAGVHVASVDNRIEGNNLVGNAFGILVDTNRNLVIRNSAKLHASGDYSIVAGNFVGTIVASEAAMNAAANDLVNIRF